MKQIFRFPKGQVLILGLVFSLLLISFISYSLNHGFAIYNKTKLQNIADSCAFSAASAQAKVLNGIAALNQGIALINNIVTNIVLIWLALRACASFCVFGFGCACVPPLRIFDRLARPVLNKLKDIAWGMAKLQDYFMRYGPIYVFQETFRIAKLNKADMVLPYPFNPGGNIKSKSTLGFHLKRANSTDDYLDSKMSPEAVKLSSKGNDALMSCYQKNWSNNEYSSAFSYYFKNHNTRNIKWIYSNSLYPDKEFDTPKGKSQNINGNTFIFSKAVATECKKVSSLLTREFKLPNPLVLRKDFMQRQIIAVLVAKSAFKSFISLNNRKPNDKYFYATAQARPFGYSIFEMTWRTKMMSVTLMSELLKKLNLLRSNLPNDA